MINFAFCYKDEKELNSIKCELERRFCQKGIHVNIRCYKNSDELTRCLSCNCPDILFYDMDDENGLVRDAAIEAKNYNHKLISIVTTSSRSSIYDKNDLLEPLYIMSDRSQRQIFTYALMAYELFLDDDTTFSYYVRPDYIHISVDDIRYFASEGRRTHIVYEDCHDTFYQKLDDVEKHILRKKACFIRIHKSYLVNSRYIASYSRSFVSLTTGERLRISRYEYYKIINDLFRHSMVKRKLLYSDY